MSLKENIAWCPGCGNFMIRDVLEKSLLALKLKPQQTVLVSGIGQAAKMPQYLNVNYFNGLHGRALPVASGIKLTRPELTVLAVSGDGCMYGEGGNHFIHAIRRNLDLTILICDNQVYALTKGQASPTSEDGAVLPLSPDGPHNRLNPLALALSAGCGFIARGFSGAPEHLQDLIQQAIKFPGTAVVDILQPCVSFNKTNTFKWYKDHTKIISAPAQTRGEALVLAEEWDNQIPLGVLYNNSTKPVYRPLLDYRQKLTREELENLIKKI